MSTAFEARLLAIAHAQSRLLRSAGYRPARQAGWLYRPMPKRGRARRAALVAEKRLTEALVRVVLEELAS